MSNLKFSVIVPIYNTEKFLEKCIDSVQNQNFESFEIILVNDGSVDNSAIICDKYVQNNSKIKVIHQENKGLSAARNTGIKNAIGDYLFFLDSDDYWRGTDIFSNIASVLENEDFDILIHDYTEENMISKKRISHVKKFKDDFIVNQKREHVIEYIFDNNLFPGSAWTTIVNRNFIKKNELYFTTGIKSEDIDWLLNVFVHAKTFKYTNDNFYTYIKCRENSITNSINIKSLEDLLFIIEKWRNQTKENKDSYIKKHFDTYLIYQYIIVVMYYSDLEKKYKKEIKSRIIQAGKSIKIMELIKSNHKIEVKLCMSIYLLFGLTFSSKIINKIYKLREAKKM